MSNDHVVQRLAVTGLFTGLTDAMHTHAFADRFPDVAMGKDQRTKTSRDVRELSCGIWTTQLVTSKRFGGLGLRV